MVYRLYMVNAETGKCTGKKRDYPSEEHFLKYGLETYKRYDTMAYFGRITKLKAKLCFLNSENKWQEVSPKELRRLITKTK